MDIEGMDNSSLMQWEDSVSFQVGQLAKDVGLHYVKGLARVSILDAAILGTQCTRANKGCRIYFSGGSLDTLSDPKDVQEVVSEIRVGDGESYQQIRPGEGHLSLIQPIELGYDILQKSRSHTRAA
jgi:hypothetical protein